MRFNPIDTYRVEAEELLAAIEQSALALETGQHTAETIHELFRAFHTIKGSGAMCGLDAIAAFTHHVESMLDKAREGAIQASPALASLVLKARDHISVLLHGDAAEVASRQSEGDSLIEDIERFANHDHTEASEPGSTERMWEIAFRPGPDLLERGGNPIALLNFLRELGACVTSAGLEQIPTLDAIQPDRCYLWWTICLRTAASENDIRDVFIFVEDTCKIEVQPLDVQTAAGPGEAVPDAEPPRSRSLAKESTVRVPSERLDRLVNLVGELVMNQSRLAQAVSRSHSPEFANPVQELERLVSELRDDVLGIRMLPIGTLFCRFRRLVHDLSAELGKDVALVTEGAETELDKSILDQLGEPLVHCLRNCLDHGVEPADERLRRGKSRQATIRLSAVHTGADVVIAVEDDGRGIDREAVRAKAAEKGLIQPDANLSDKDIYNLILMPGFSTAKEVTAVSGRGVGMDAVRRQIEALRGSLSIASEPGQNTRLSIRLPLTLAIIDGLLVEVGGDQFILPMAAVSENVELTAAERRRNNGRNVIAVRGELTPYIDLRAMFRMPGTAPAVEKVVIVHHDGDRVGLVVDRVLGTHQTVIQSLGKFYRSIEVVSGATIMGDGRVALIMDIAAVVRFAGRQSLGPSLVLAEAVESDVAA